MTLGLCATAAAQSLPPEVDAALARARIPRDAVAVVVAEASGGTPRVALRAQAAVNPASVMKLVTTYAGLDLLGPAYLWNTQVFLGGPVDANGTLQGDLTIRGQGDPALVLERLWLLLRRVQAQGVRSIAGDIVLDHSAFALPAHDPADFDGEPFRPYNAAPDALLLNFKSVVLNFVPDPAAGSALVSMEPPLAGVRLPQRVPLAPAGSACGDWRTGLQANVLDATRIALAGSFPASCGEKAWPMAYADPQSYAERAVEGMWRELGGRISGRVRDGRAPAGKAPTLQVASPPLGEVIRDINKYSNNVMAQQLFLTLSLQARGTGSFEGSRAVVEQWWRERISATDPVPLVDNGAGLSREARITALGLAHMLQAAWRSPQMPELLASLPIAGIDGTLRRSRARSGSAHLKTGSLRDVAAMAGFVHGEDGRRWVLVAIVNHPNAGAARPAFDALVDWTAQQPEPVASK
ncbi:D-alanyl-D-alanine carboxypeptidase/D-alanyl-D-alanine-endopeptidase [Xylophilus sp. GW821-FHT01B05]